MIGEHLLHYEILAKLGEGGMGVVYKARDAHLDRFVAIKVLPPEKVSDPTRKARFVQEAKAASALNHPNIITIYDISSDAGHDFIAMEYVAGKTLDQLIPHKGMRLNEALKIAVQIADALARAHAAGIIHRDLKPANIMVDEHGQVKVLDFGLAKLAETTTSPEAETLTNALDTAEGTVVGTAAYMSPEQAEAEPVDARSDIFSFGSVLYEVLTGQRAFAGSSLAVVYDAVLNRTPLSLRSLNPQTPRGFDEIVAKALQKDQRLRYQSAAELANDLRRIERESAFAPGRTTESSRIEAIAVLPLELLSRDADQEYFSDGLTEELITQLSKIGSLRVISRTSVMQFKGARKLMSEIARTLGVDAVVEGSILRLGDRIRISARLIDAHSDCHLWGDRYDRELRDVFALLSEVAVAIAHEVRVKLTPREQVRLTAARQVDPEAYEEYLRGLHHWGRLSRDGYEKAVELFEGAIRKDPDFASSYAALAVLEHWRANSSYVAPAEVRAKAIAAAEKAVELDDLLAEAHAARAWVKFSFEHDLRTAESEFKRVLELNPNSARARSQYAVFLVAIGRNDESIAETERARRLEPTSATVMWECAIVYYEARRFDRALAQLHLELELYPNTTIAHALMAAILARQGRKAESLAALDRVRSLLAECEDLVTDGWVIEAHAFCGNHAEALRLLEKWESIAELRYVDATTLAFANAAVRRRDKAIALLERAAEEKSPMFPWLRSQPSLEPLHADARYQALVRRMNYAW